ncbi:PREDICTED: PCTP-like protein [Amphimedon queenslandica]|uniref:START domain-containing protein n=1 Tax=Amphimedon queenslandica TaxID=400682 RepID=A0A1X7SN41_AMPQE|nr:PREDICTED: PCTP-like protein [Amphimedon queenslandica]|eukprot:XP_019863321.1 PREDICTED: PCTP-like protein [Amphimedon queenslandica]
MHDCVAIHVGKIPKWLLNIVASKIAPRIFLKIAQAAEKYPEWKKRNRPEHRPWVDPTKYGVPIVSISELLQFSPDTIPLTPRVGEPDYLGSEEQLEEDNETVPDGIESFLANGGGEGKTGNGESNVGVKNTPE